LLVLLWALQLLVNNHRQRRANLEQYKRRQVERW
jgi:hypothetical protein